MHDLDCPWRPRDLEQRAGRIVRQGNADPKVDIYRYVTESTFDAYLWQTVEHKQKFISQIMTSRSPVRSCEDLDESALSYAEIKALCAGNPLIKEKIDLDVEVARLRVLKADHQNQHYQMQDDVLIYIPRNIQSCKENIASFERDKANLEAFPSPEKSMLSPMEIDGRIYIKKDEAGTALLDACKNSKGADPITIGGYKGFTMNLSFSTHEKAFKLTLKGEMNYTATLDTNAVGNIQRIHNALAELPKRLSSAQAHLENLGEQLEKTKLELTKPFALEEELNEKEARLSTVNAELGIEGGLHGQAAIEEAAKRQSIANFKPSIIKSLDGYRAEMANVSACQNKAKEDLSI